MEQNVTLIEQKIYTCGTNYRTCITKNVCMEQIVLLEKIIHIEQNHKLVEQKN
jgi:hypothetical protein